MTDGAQPRVEVSPHCDSGILAVREQWEALEAVAEPPPYLTFSWLEAWSAVYTPTRMRVIRISATDGAVIALGLLQDLRGRRLRFAGGPVSPLRGLMCRPEDEPIAWSSLGAWLGRHRYAWTSLDADGVAPEAGMIPRAGSIAGPWLAFELDASFDAYLAARPARVRKSFTRKLRAAERHGASAEPVEPTNCRAALDTFVNLHRSRALAKGEVHRHIDSRLAEMLSRLQGRAGPTLAIVALAHDTMTLAVTVRIDHRQRSWFYNAGFEPTAAQLSPGLVVELRSIRDAIERGQRWYDLGPGDYRYKRELGGQERSRVAIRSTSSSFGGQLALASRKLRESDRVRAGYHGLSKLRHDRLGAERTRAGR